MSLESRVLSRDRYDIRFTGRVQGVGFRYTTCRVAERFQVTGCVQNLADGSVRCVAEGEPEELDTFVEAIQEEMARYIVNTRIDRSPACGEFDRFSVRF